MKVIKELSYVLNRNKTRSIEIIGDAAMQSSSKLAKLYNIIQNPEVETDEDAAYLLYGERKVSGKYRTLKSKLKTRLYNTFLFIDVNEAGGARELAYHNCWKDWATNRMAVKISAIEACYKIGLKVFKVALQNEFSDLIVVTTLFLRNYCALKKKNKKEFDKYNDYYHQYHKITHYENLADEYYQRLILDHTLKSILSNPQIKEDAEKYYAELNKVADEIPTVRFHMRLYDIQMLGYMGVYDYRMTKKIADEALSIYADNPNMAKNNLRNFYLHKLVCHIQLKEFEEGKTAAEACKNLLTEGTFNWFKAHEHFYMLAMQTGKYQEAYLTERTVAHHPRFKTLPAYFQEMWILNKGYLHFLVAVNQVQLLPEDKRFSTFRLNKFLNEMPALAQDKRGMNIPVLILQSAFYILQNKEEKAIDRIEAIEKYRIRYVKKDDPNYRSNTFVKMMQEISKGGFDAHIIARKAKKYVKNLEEVPFDMMTQAHETEVIPYAVIWDWMLQMMRRNRMRHNRTEQNRSPSPMSENSSFYSPLFA